MNERLKDPRILALMGIAVLGGIGLSGCNLLPQDTNVSPIPQASSKVPLLPSVSAVESRSPSSNTPTKPTTVGNTTPTKTISVSVKSQPSVVRLPYTLPQASASVETLPYIPTVPGPEVVPQ